MMQTATIEDLYLKYEAVIGLEIHAQLSTQTKLFVADANKTGQAPNTQVSPITLAHPGTLPLINRKAVEMAIKMGLACDCKISRYNYFDRKNYFYPDLPKGYQITQEKTPICIGGEIPFRVGAGDIRTAVLNRIHLEEDAGKSVHEAGKNYSKVDYNRAGVPLIEIVTEPCLSQPEEVFALMYEVRKMLRYLEVCSGNMEEGSLRCDANVSVRLKGAKKLGRKVEIKNMNSMRNVSRAVKYEIERQMQVVDQGGEIFEETRLFNLETGKTASMRMKETLNDYRYFPDPDIVPFVVDEKMFDRIKASVPEMPLSLYNKYINNYGLSDYDANFLVDESATATYFEEMCGINSDAKANSNWLMGPIKSILNSEKISIQDLALSPKVLVELIDLVKGDKLSFSAASQQLLPELMNNLTETPLSIAQRLNLIQESNVGKLEEIAAQVMVDFPEKVKAFKSGKKGLLGFFMGQLMQRSQGKAEPKLANQILLKLLK